MIRLLPILLVLAGCARTPAEREEAEFVKECINHGHAPGECSIAGRQLYGDGPVEVPLE